jgi:hypothetical protein
MASSGRLAVAGMVNVLGWIRVGRDMARFSLISLRLYVWLCGVVEVLQFEGVG